MRRNTQSFSHHKVFIPSGVLLAPFIFNKKHCTTQPILALVFTMLASLQINAQIKIGDNPGTINPNSIIELESTNQGIVVPRVTLNDATTPAPLLAGLEVGTLIFNINGTEPTGHYFWNGLRWVQLSESEPWRESITANDAIHGSTTNMYYPSGNVGIGNSTPDDPLDVVGISHLNGPLFVGGKTSSNQNGLQLFTDETNNYIDSRLPVNGFTFIRADNNDGTTIRLALDNTSGFLGVNYGSGSLISELDVNGIMHIRGNGVFQSDPGLHLMYNTIAPNANSVELVSDHANSSAGQAGFSWYTTLLNQPLKIMTLDTLGILNLNQYGENSFHYDSVSTGTTNVTYLLGVQSDGDMVETPNLSNSYFEGDIGGFSVLSAFPVTVDATETSDLGGNFNPANSTYTVPYDGLYLLKLNGFATALASIEIKIKIGTDSSEDGTEYFIPLQGAVSSSVESSQLVEFQKGDAIRVYVDTGIGTQFTISRGYWTIICVQPF